MQKINVETLPKDLKKMKSNMEQLEIGLKNLDPKSDTFIYEYAIYEKRISIISKAFSELISYLQNIHDKQGLARRQLKRLIEVNNRIHLKAQGLKPIYIQLSQAS